MKIFFSVGEPSGDIHGANLIKDLKRRVPEVECVGYGGPAMKRAGCELHADLTELAVMWLLRVLVNLHKFWALASEADRYFRHHKPDAVVLIDYPGFNWWIARRAKAHGIPVFYYGAPQLWAWASWRVNKMRRLIDHVLCKLPFEEKWYRDRGCNATYIGHPFFDETERQVLDQQFLDTMSAKAGPLVTILPGSRTQEVTNNLRWQLKAAALVHKAVPDVRFALASYKESQAQMARQAIDATDLPIEVYIGRTPELIQLGECCLAVSGSVSLELLHHTKPTVIIYWVSRSATRLMKHVLRLKVRFITLVNLIATDEPFSDNPEPFDPNSAEADQVPMPEYPTSEDKSQQLAAHLIEWLTDDAARQRKIDQLAALKAKYGQSGASDRAADYICKTLGQLRLESKIPRPHFMPESGSTDASAPASQQATSA